MNRSLRTVLPTVALVALGVMQGLGGGFTDQATVSGSSASTGTLVASTPTAAAVSRTSVDLAWDSVPAGDTAAEFTVMRSGSADGSDPEAIYTGTGTSVTDLGDVPAELSSMDVTDIGVTSSKQSSEVDHACAIADGAAYCWGSNEAGELGGGFTSAYSSIPIAVTGMEGMTVSDISVGIMTTCAVADEAVYCWGNNYYGSLGDGTNTTSSSAVAVTGIDGPVSNISPSGNLFSCAISDGTVYCWGSNSIGQLGDGTTTDSNTAVAVSGLDHVEVTDVQSSEASACALADGVLYCWGYNINGELGGLPFSTRTPTAVPGLAGLPISSFSLGIYQTCAMAEGAAYCWGNNAGGQLRDGTTNNSSSPIAVPPVSGATIASIVAGDEHICAISDTGDAYCWGNNPDGVLGDGTTIDSTEPVAVALPAGMVTTLRTAPNFACAVADGDAYCWGRNGSGELGDGTDTARATPAPVSMPVSATCAEGADLVTATECSLSPGATYYYRVDYTVANWSAPASAWVGIRTASPELTARTPVLAHSNEYSIDISWDDVPAGSDAGEFILQRSYNSDGADPFTVYMGPATTTTDRGLLPQDTMAVDITDVSASYFHTCVLGSGQAYCAGSDVSGATGNDPSAPTSSLAVVGGLYGMDVTAVSNGYGFSCAIADNDAYCWGENNYGQLGDGKTTSSSEPVRVDAPSGTVFTSISAGATHACAVASDSLYCWGENDYGQLGDSTTNTSSSPVETAAPGGTEFSAVEAGAGFTCGLADGTAYCWGLNSYLELGAGLTSDYETSPVAVLGLPSQHVTAITAGTYSACALADGSAFCWGTNTNGALGTGNTSDSNGAVAVAAPDGGAVLTNFTTISVNAAQACGIASGDAYCWGDNGDGQVGDGTTTSRDRPTPVVAPLAGKDVTAISAGWSNSCAIAEGLLYCWGANYLGQFATNGGNSLVPTAASLVETKVCAPGSTVLPGQPAACSLTTATTYYYRLVYFVGNVSSPLGPWTALSTSLPR